MTQDEIIEIYKEVSNKLCNGTEWCWAGVGEPLQLFVKLVDAKATERERERIANKVDELGDGDPVYTWWVAEQIRAEGDKQ